MQPCRNLVIAAQEDRVEESRSIPFVRLAKTSSRGIRGPSFRSSQRNGGSFLLAISSSRCRPSAVLSCSFAREMHEVLRYT
jgi:hypothetical protein